jgi:lipid-A-disaccharide synthase
MHIFFSVGEPSGDQHAAHLIEELRRRQPDLQCSGYGGPLMEQAGCRVLFRLTNLAVMGFLRVVPLLWQFYRLVRDAKHFFQQQRPDAVVLVDFPGFNWWIARKAKAAGIPVFYYLPPQLWAWAPWRIRRVRKHVDYVLCGLPFERKWYAERGIQVDYVGHPFFDEVADVPLDRKFLQTWATEETTNVGLLPGSRQQEITRNWPLMLQIIERLHARHPHVRFLVACYKQSHLELCREMLSAGQNNFPIHWFVGKTSEIIEVADCCLMVSGSVSLEMLARETPAAVVYRIGSLINVLKGIFLRVDWISLPNLMAGRKILPEWVVCWFPQRDVQCMTATLDGWLSDPRKLKQAVRELSGLRHEIAQTGATARTAEAILSRLTSAGARKAA